jgi:serine protease Do
MRGATLCSGVIVHADGYILTVLYAAGNGAVSVSHDGKNYQGKVVATDAAADLALVKIDAKNLPVVRLGDSDAMEVGDIVIGVGAPFGFEQSVTTGVISYKNRKRKPEVPLLQNTVATDDKNAGAPLVNVNGEVIGIGWAINGNNFVGLGYAVPINAFKQKLQKQIPAK